MLQSVATFCSGIVSDFQVEQVPGFLIFRLTLHEGSNRPPI